MSGIVMPKIVTSGLQCCLDAANPKSYPGTGIQWNDLSGNGNHGILAGASLPIWNPGGWFSFVGGHGISVEDNYNRIGISNRTPFNFSWNTSFSIILLFRTAKNDTVDHTIFSNYDPLRVSGGYFLIVIDSDEKFKTVIQADAAKSATSSNAVNDNLWHICSIVYSTNNLKVYLDNQLITNSVDNPITSGNFYSDNGLAIYGVRKWNTGYMYDYSGDIAMFQMYNRVLTTVEITQNYNALKGRFGL